MNSRQNTMTDQQSKTYVTSIRITAKHDKFLPAARARQILEGEKTFEIESEHATYGGMIPIRFSTEYTRYFMHVYLIVSISYKRKNGEWEDIPLLDWMRTDRSKLIPLMTKDRYMMETIEYARTTARKKKSETSAIMYSMANEMRRQHDKLAMFDPLSLAFITHNDNPSVDDMVSMKQTTNIIQAASQNTQDITIVESESKTSVANRAEEKPRRDETLVAPLMTIAKTAAQAKLHEIKGHKLTDAFGTIGFEFSEDIDTYNTDNGFLDDRKRHVFDLTLSGMVKQDENTKIAGLYIFGIDGLPFSAPVNELGVISIPEKLTDAHLATIELLKQGLLEFFANNKHRDGFVLSMNVMFMDDESRTFFARMLREYVFLPLLAAHKIPSVDIVIMYIASIPEIVSRGFECAELFGEGDTCITFNVNHHVHI